MVERLLYRISKSKYKNNFILKGGLLLSSIFGDERRTTQDMDTMIKGLPLDMKTLENIKKIPREIAHLLSKDKKLCSLLIDDSNEPKIENLPSFEFLLNNNYINLMTPIADGQINQKGRNNTI